MKTRHLIRIVFLALIVAPPIFAEPTFGSEVSSGYCEVWDEPGVVHARAADELGALTCLGYLHGRDRAWQMDFLRRIVEGRRAEILGYKSLKDDLQMRILGLDRKARQVFERMSEAERAPFQAYALGVNRGFETEKAKQAYEFREYGYQPEPWHPIHSLEVLLLQSFDQTQKTFTHKIVEQEWINRYGDEAASLFARDGFPWVTDILKPGEYPVSSRVSRGPEIPGTSPKSDPIRVRSIFPTEGVGLGSNNWVLSGARSQSGHALFANDPHLDLKHPPFWYWAHIEGGKIDAIGASLPGVPTIASGSNRSVAWGLTNAYFDVSELTFVPTDDLRDTKMRWPLVWVRFGKFKLPFFFVPYQRTRQGWPVLPLESDSVPSGKSLVLRWSGFEVEPKDFVGIFEVLTAQTVQDADRAFSRMGVPTWNFVYADIRGGIGYRTVGKLPRREQALPFGIPQRRLQELEPWTYLTADEAPHILNPSRGYIVTANNRQWAPNSALSAGRAQTTGFRAYRIEELLNRSSKHDRSSIQSVQCDNQAVDARFIVPHLLKAVGRASELRGGLSAREEKVLGEIAGWDFDASLTCKACGVYVRWTERLLELEELNHEGLYRILIGAPKPEFLDTVIETFREALNDLRVVDDGELKPWGEIHRNAFTHFSKDPAFSVPSIPTPGVENSVSPGSGSFDEKTGTYSQSSGASQRLIVEMSDPPTIHVMLAGSNQDVYRPNLADPNGPWMKWQRCEVEKRTFPVDWKQVRVEVVQVR